MSPNQKFKFFMPAWNRCCKLNGWHTREKAAVIDAPLHSSAELNQVFALARQRAIMDGRAMTLRDMRHACYIVAAGRDKDTDSLNNKEIDRIVTLFNLLADPLDLKARQNWEAYKRGEDPGAKVRRRNFIHTRAPEAMLRHITMDLTSGQTKDPDSLDDKKEAELCRLLAQRPVYSGAPRSKRTYQLDPNKTYVKGPF